MIVLTVKTLDSQNHSFTVEDDITVEQFKAHIADTVNIPVETQRIIYCGRVLQDSSKLSDYDVNGKVVHLVQRAPPTSSQRSSGPATPPVQQPRGSIRRIDGNAMYLGSMAIPSNLMESQGLVPPPPTHSLAGSRLNVARRMLRRAEGVLNLLENPSARPNEQPPPEDNQEEEVTPVIEARVIVPGSTTEPLDHAMVLSAVQNSLLNAGSMSLGTRERAEGSTTHSNTESAQRSREQSGESTPNVQTPRSASTENLASDSRTENGSNVLSENASRTTEMAELLTQLGQLQTRFVPFLERYQAFMQEDPIVATENVRQTQAMLTRVSEVLHFLGHAYHSLSDIIIRVRTPPPRPLLCRPILIQHSAVVQAGIPIQVEAQINLSAERVPPPPSTTANTSQPSTTAAADGAPATTESSDASTAGRTPTTTASQQGFTARTMGIPGLFPHTVRVQSFPMEIRPVTRPTGSTTRPQNNNNNGSDGATSTSTTSTPTATTTTASASAGGTTGGSAAGGGAAEGNSFNFNNPNVEFFMEVTPEGITIDSLETTLVGSNRANDLLRGALNGPPPEFLQSLMQMAGQFINRGGAAVPTTSTPPASTATAATDSNQSSQSNASSQATAAGQNSQARGNTQTNPTTATHTRSTPRPHVHLAQQAMQGGFDPFLPCNSHHVTHRRRMATTVGGQSSAASGSRTEGGRPAQNDNIYNFINGLINTVRTVYSRRGSDPAASPSAAATPANSANSASQPNSSTGNQEVPQPPLPPFASLLTNLSGQTLPDLIRQGPTLEQLLQQLHQDEPHVQGESIFSDLIMLLISNITLVDLFTLNSGMFEPIYRNRMEIRNFFRTRVLEGCNTADGVDRGVDRIILEMQPFFENFNQLQVRDDIDMARSAEMLFRNRLPNIINIASNLSPNTVRILIEQCITTIKQLCALTLRASLNGQQGVEQVFVDMVNRFMQNVPRDIQEWTLMTSRVNLRQIMANLSVPDSILQPYIVRQSELTFPSVADMRQHNVAGDHSTQTPINDVEAMELDEQEATGSGNELGSPTIILEDTEPLPNIVLGSEPWHGQVPEDWVPIIARDAQKQRRQNPQGPFSDAYLSGMPSKRRKIVNSNKPEGSLSQVISESVRQAVTATGLTNAAPLDNVVQAAGASTEIQTAYRSLLRSSVQASLRDNEDFTAERFPNASNYFNNPQQ